MKYLYGSIGKHIIPDLFKRKLIFKAVIANCVANKIVYSIDDISNIKLLFDGFKKKRSNTCSILICIFKIQFNDGNYAFLQSKKSRLQDILRRAQNLNLQTA